MGTFFDPQPHERRNVVVAAFDNEDEFIERIPHCSVTDARPGVQGGNCDHPHIRTIGYGREHRGASLRRLTSAWREVAVEPGGGDAAVDEYVAAGDEGAVGSHQQGSDCGDLVGGAGSPGG